jgi:hypothetical protein
MFRRKPLSLRRTLLRAVLTPVFILAAGAAGYAAVSHLPATMVMAPPPAPAPAAPAEPSRAEVLIAKHDCWTGAAPADMEGVVPGHVVMTLKNGKTVYHGSLGVEAALQHVFDAPLPGIKAVHAFCR